MRIFIVDDVEKLTTNYHSGGGLVVIAEDLEAAKALFVESQVGDYYDEEDAPVVTEEEWASAKVLDVASEAEPAIHVFPDAGCC